MLSNCNFFTKLDQPKETQVFFYIGTVMWFHNHDLYENSDEKNETWYFVDRPITQ